MAETQDLAHGDLVQLGDYRIVLQDEAVDAEVVEVEPDSPDPKDTASRRRPPPPPPPLRASNATFLEKPNRLVVLAGPNPGEEFPLVGERLTIGRAEDATISINHNSVSRLHCEVHALGEGRFEIVDKGSSNGVRVNGADLRRGIIEAGDLIELGDVRFKFVGEGQLFRPGTTDSQQLAAIGHRSATGVVRGSSKMGSVLPAIGVGAVVVVGLVVFWAFRTAPPRAESPTLAMTAASTAADTTGVDAAMLAEARRMCDVGEVEAAHQKASQLAPDSPLHASDDFKYVETKWTEMALIQAGFERDPLKQTAIFQRLLADPYIESGGAEDGDGAHGGGRPVAAAGQAHRSGGLRADGRAHAYARGGSERRAHSRSASRRADAAPGGPRPAPHSEARGTLDVARRPCEFVKSGRLAEGP